VHDGGRLALALAPVNYVALIAFFAFVELGCIMIFLGTWLGKWQLKAIVRRLCHEGPPAVSARKGLRFFCFCHTCARHQMDMKFLFNAGINAFTVIG
jgi:hypothetical protein